jgi:hypothetical protein
MSSPIPTTDRIDLDPRTVESRAALYPEDLREPFIWLASYFREDCTRDLDLFVTRANDLGITTDRTNWSKVLRGKWNRDQDGKETAPCIALEKLLRYIDTIRKDAQIKELGGRIPYVKTPTGQLIWNFINIRRAPDRVNKLGVVIGETGTQKTATFKEYVRQNNHGTCVWLDSPANGKLNRFITDLAVSYGEHVRSTRARKEYKIQEAVNWRKTIILENIQRLYNPAEEGNQEVFNYIQTLQEKTNCTFILSFTPTFEKTFTAGINRGFFEQFVGRAGGTSRFLRLEPFPTTEDVEAIAKAFKVTGLNDKTTWPKFNGERDKVTVLEYLERIAHQPGRIRTLFEDLQDAKIAAEADRKSVTIDYIKEAREED